MFLSRKPRTADGADAALSPVEPLPASHAGVFLGALRSDVDEPDLLAEPFERLAVVAEGVVGAYRRRMLSAQEAAERLQVLRLTSAQNVDWTLGATSLRWYRRLPGSIWNPAVPPSQGDDQMTESADRAIEAVAAMASPVPALEVAPSPAQPARDLPAPAGNHAGTGLDADSDLDAGGDRAPWSTDAARDDSDDDVHADGEAASGAPEEDPAARDWSFTEKDEGESHVHVYPAEAPVIRRTIPTLQAVLIDDLPADDDGYGEYPGSAVAPPAASEPLAEHSEEVEDPSEEPAPAHAGSPADVAGTERAESAVEEDPELRAMLAALAQDTGIELTGFGGAPRD